VRVDSEPAADLGPTDVGQVVAEAATELAPLLARHHLELKAGIRLFALTDPGRLHQILEHLVENAVKYAPPETTIKLDWRMADGSVRIGVEDEGPGIPEEWRERIFEPYARRDTHTARGSGIGLYAARKLADSVGARLWCEPANGHGARFVIALPAAAAI
jgi:signal transduction histidine kinase